MCGLSGIGSSKRPFAMRCAASVSISNGDFVLKKGDEIIFTHDGETYSSQVYAIKGDDISVKYRGKKIDIKPSDIKKIY